MVDEGFIRTATIDEAIALLNRMNEMALDVISAQTLPNHERVYVTRSINHLVLSDGIGLSCYGGTSWEVRAATFCFCYNRQTAIVEECKIFGIANNIGADF